MINPLETVRDIIGRWPETDERISHGTPTFWGGKKTFASYHDNHHGDGRLALWIKCTEEGRGIFIDMDADTYFVPPYVGPSGWIGVRLEGDPDWGKVEDLLLGGYRMVAPKRALKALEA